MSGGQALERHLARSGERVRVLLAESSEDNREVYGARLAHAGFAVVDALNGEEALTRARAEAFDVVVVRGLLPIFDGWEVAERLRVDEATAHLPVILVTARDWASAVERARQAGVHSYLVSPVDLSRLVGAVLGAAVGDPGDYPRDTSPF